MDMRKRQPIGVELVKRGIVTEKDIEKALEYQREHPNRKLGDILYILDVCDPNKLIETIGEIVGTKGILLNASTIKVKLTDYISLDVAKKNKAVPFEVSSGKIKVCFANTVNSRVIDTVRLLLLNKGLVMESYITFESDIDKILKSLEGVATSNLEAAGRNDTITGLVDSIIKTGMERRASDIHIEPMQNQVRVRYRIDGELFTAAKIEKEKQRKLAEERSKELKSVIDENEAKYGSDWKYDSTNHWHECSRCHDKKDEAAHDYGSDNVCDTCGYDKTVPHTHNLTLVAAKAATCTEGGKEAYYKCEGCGKFYEDVLGTKEITDLASWGNIAKIAHTTKQTVTKATPTANGEIVNYCSVCKKALSTTVIPKASSIKLKATSLTYNGKVRTPKVIVKDRTGKTLVKNTDYTVSYAKGRKYVGKYAVKITFKGKYSGTKTLYFTIKPKATSISSLKAGSKKFTVKWKKQATQTTGYQVQYSASSKFSKAKTVTVGKNTTVSKKISKLSGKKKYYVRVRTYKTVKINGKSIRIYSGWSKAKTVTTKK